MARQATKAEAKIILIVAGILFILTGISVLGYGISTIIKAWNMKNWPTTEGIITHSDARWQRPHTGRGSSTLIADIKYKYEVNSRLYSCDSISQGQFGSNDTSHARKEVGMYPVGKKVIVYYNPDNPLEAVLELGWGWINAIALAVGTAAFIAGVFMLRYRLTIGRSRQ